MPRELEYLERRGFDVNNVWLEVGGSQHLESLGVRIEDPNVTRVEDGPNTLTRRPIQVAFVLSKLNKLPVLNVLLHFVPWDEEVLLPIYFTRSLGP